MAFPVAACYGYWKSRKKHAAVGNALIQFVKSNIQGLTPRTPWLLVFTNAIYIEFFRCLLSENLVCRFRILGTN